MADTLKFGPEWLRTLADGGSVTSPPPSPSFAKFKLAEHRYGREEFLALFNPKSVVPEELLQSPSIVVEKAQTPMSLLAPSEDEQRLLSQSVNSTAVLRVMGRGGPAPRGGRGGGPDRGRGRGRGRDGFYSRGPYDEDSSGFSRPRMHNRSESWEDGREPKWFERDRYSGRAFDEPPSPRKDFSRSMSSDNWREARKHEEEDEDGDWRKAGSKSWSRSNWRESGEGRRYYTTEYHEDRGGGFHRDGYGRERHNSRSRYMSGSHDEDQEDVPEWSLMDPDEDVGTFDASGAFVSMKDLKELEDQSEVANGRPDEDGDKNITVKNGADEKPKQKESRKAGKDLTEIDKPVSLKESSSAEDRASSGSQNNVDIKQRQDSETDIKSASIVVNSAEADKLLQSQCVEEKPVSNAAPPNDTVSSVSSAERVASEVLDSVKVNGDTTEEDNFDHLARAAVDMVDTWTAEEEEKSNAKAKIESGGVPLDHEDAKKWFYMDPQGDLQGPFTSSEMAEWFSAGYFTMSLSVKRGCDERFQPLGELIKRWGRIPFMPGQSPPPLLNNAGSVDAATDQLKQQLLKQQQQQMIMQQQLLQQSAIMRQQIQMQMIVQQLQQQEDFSKLTQPQQMALIQQLFLKQHQQQLLQQMAQKASPRSPPTSEANSMHRSMSQPSDLHHANFQRSMSQPSTEDESAWPGNNPPVSGAWTQGGSVWDIEPSQAPSLQDIQRMEQEKIRKEREKVEAELRAQQVREEEEKQRKLEELQRQQEEEMRLREEMRRQQEEMARREAERQRQLEQQAQEEARRREEEERKRREAEAEGKRKYELLRQQRELQERQQQREAELERQAQEELRRRQRDTTAVGVPPMDAQRQQEVKRQQDALRRLQQAQLAQMQLPATAQWANCSAGPTQGTTTLSLSQIQQLQEEKERKEREQQKQRLAELQRQQMQALHGQHHQQKSWAAQISGQQPVAKSLLEIQEEQARQLEKEQQRQQQHQQARNMQLGTAAAWGSQSGWATEGAWAQNKTSLGFWDEAVVANSRKPAQNNAAFPTLSASASSPAANVNANRQKNAKTKKEEETVQRLFQVMKPVDEFTQWCERALKGMQTSVDVPTFIAFLQDVESPSEVQDYVRSYLGETQQARDFAKEFIDKRSAFKQQGKHSHNEFDSMTGAVKVNPTEWSEAQKSSRNKKKKKMQRIDGAAVLGFSVQADSNRKNVGEIEALE